MANTNLTISMITREFLRILENNLVFANQVNRQYDNQFAKTGAKVGATINIRKPVRWTVSDGEGIDIQDAEETQVPLTLNKRKHIAFTFSTQELALDIDDFSKRYLRTAAAALANQIDRDGLELFKEVYNMVGTRGTVPNTLLTYLDAKTRLDEEAAPRDNTRCVVIGPDMEGTIVNALTGLFHDSSEISKQYRRGEMGMAAGFKFMMDQNIWTHTAGTFTTGSTPLVNGASQTGSSLVTDGWQASTAILTEGDIITLASVNAVNPQNRQDTGSLRQFVVTSDVSSDGSGDATIPISPAITVSGPYQTVTQSPANNAAITPAGTEAANSPQGLAFHEDAFCLATADLPLPGGVHMASRVQHRGISIRAVRQYDINTDKIPCRLDVLYGWKTLYPELACRVAS